MKHTFTAIGILLLIGVFFWFFQNSAAPLTSSPSTETFEGTVTAVNLEEMMVDGPARITVVTGAGKEYKLAVPSMGRSLCKAKDTVAAPDTISLGDRISVRGEVAEDGSLVPCMDESHYLTVSGVYADSTVGMLFWYRKGPNGYVRTELPKTASTDPSFVKGVMLTLESDYQELQQAVGAREGSPTLTVRIYNNPNKQSASVWATTHPLESNIRLAPEGSREAVVGGANAVRYLVDGLYPTDTYVVASGSRIYVFTGAYLDAGDPQKSDFEPLIQSVSFIQETA